MLSLLTRRVVLVTGKGGVGKTVLAAALARAAAWSGKRVLAAEVASEGNTPSALAEALGAKASAEEPVRIAPGIRSVLLTPSMGHRRFLQDTFPVRMVADAAMRSTAIRRFLHAAPAFGEMGVLYRMLDLLRQKRSDGSFEHEIAVVDLPATGHALAITQLPEVILKIIPGGPIGRAVREGLSLLTDPRSTGTLVVTLPEGLPVSESLELVEGLSRHKVPLSAMVANRVPSDPFTADERAEVDSLNAAAGPLLGVRALKRLDRAVSALERLQQSSRLPVFSVPEMPERGPALSERLAQLLLAAYKSSPAQAGKATR
ncbi:MAG: arsenic transporter [Deltaproteobacteria bacterium]|nr:arsenic transporter [Deltaproteobacteria bacterium]